MMAPQEGSDRPGLVHGTVPAGRFCFHVRLTPRHGFPTGLIDASMTHTDFALHSRSGSEYTGRNLGKPGAGDYWTLRCQVVSLLLYRLISERLTTWRAK